MNVSLCEKIKRYVFRYIDSNMYIIVDKNEALIIDPHIDKEADIFLKEKDVKNVLVLLTHEHFDHTCGIPWFREHYNTEVVCQKNALDSRSQRFNCRSISVSLVLSDQGRNDDVVELEKEYPSYTFTAEIIFESELDFNWHEHSIHMEHLPGHSPASTLIIIDEENVFTGDSLVPGCEPTLRWPGSDAALYKKNVIPRLMNLPDKDMIYPGHRDPVIRKKITYSNSIWKTL